MKIKKARDGIEVTLTEEESKALMDESKPVVTVTDERGGEITRTLSNKPMTWKFTFKNGKLDYQPVLEEVDGKMCL